MNFSAFPGLHTEISIMGSRRSFFFYIQVQIKRLVLFPFDTIIVTVFDPPPRIYGNQVGGLPSPRLSPAVPDLKSLRRYNRVQTLKEDTEFIFPVLHAELKIQTLPFHSGKNQRSRLNLPHIQHGVYFHHSGRDNHFFILSQFPGIFRKLPTPGFHHQIRCFIPGFNRIHKMII